MNLNILNIDGRKVAAGLEWELLPIDDPINVSNRKLKDELRKRAKEVKYKYGFTFSNGVNVSAAFSDKNTKEISGALALALSQREILETENNFINKENVDTSKKDWIVVQKSDNMYWMSVIKNGLPTPGSDFVTDDINMIYSKLEDCAAIDTFILLSNVLEVEEKTQELGILPNLIKISFSDILLKSNIDEKELKKKSKLFNITGVKKEYIVFAASLFVLGLAYLSYDFISDELDKRSAQKAREAKQSAERIKLEQEFKKKTNDYYIKYNNEKNKSFDIVNKNIKQIGKETFDSWINYINVPIPIGGWNLTNITCSVNTEATNLAQANVCVKTLEKKGITTNEILLKYFPSATMPSPTSNKANVKDYFQAYYNQENNVSNYDFIDLDTFAIHFVSHMQKLKFVDISFDLGKTMEEIKFSPPKPPTPPAELRDDSKTAKVKTKASTKADKKVESGKPLRIGYAEGEFSLTGSQFHKLQNISEYMFWDSISLKSINIDFKDMNNPKWKIEFSYMIKSEADDLEPPPVGKYTAADFNLSENNEK